MGRHSRMRKPAIAFVHLADTSVPGSGIERPEVQRFAISQFANEAGYEIIERFVEKSSLQGHEGLTHRPTLKQAVNAALRHNAPIIVADIDRLGTGTAILSELMMHGVAVIIAGLDVGTKPFVLVPADDVARQVAPSASPAPGRARTRKSRTARPASREAIADRNRRHADERANELADIIKSKLAAGKSLRRIAEELNTENVPTARGGRWHLATVQRLVARLNRQGR